MTASKLNENDSGFQAPDKTTADNSTDEPSETSTKSQVDETEHPDGPESNNKRTDDSNEDALTFDPATNNSTEKNSTPADTVDDSDTETEGADSLTNTTENKKSETALQNLLNTEKLDPRDEPNASVDAESPNEGVHDNSAPNDSNEAATNNGESEPQVVSEKIDIPKKTAQNELIDDEGKRSHGDDEAEEKTSSTFTKVKISNSDYKVLYSNLYDPSNVDYKPQTFVFRQNPILQMTRFVQKDNRISNKGTIYVQQNINSRIMQAKRAKLKSDMMKQIFDSFLLLPKCVQKALEWCYPNSEKLLKECESNKNGRQCLIKDYYAILKCDVDETMINDTCYKNCPQGFIEYKAFCLKPSYIKRSTKEYRGERLKENEEFWGDHLIVEKCSIYGPYMEAAGPDYCRAYCPTGFHDRGMFCQKPYKYLKQPPVYYDQNNANQVIYNRGTNTETK